jgi:signal transduction histidine kinase
MTAWRDRLAQALGLRVAVWYAVIFLCSSIAVGLLAYTLLATSLERRDHDLLRVKLAEYANRYEIGGLRALSETAAAEQASGSPDAVLIRLVGRRSEVLLTSAPAAWRGFEVPNLDDARRGRGEIWSAVTSDGTSARLEVVSSQLWDGTIMQVGRTTLGRERLLEQVREIFGFVFIVVVAIGLAGGVALTQSALQPLRRLRDAVTGIARTGRLHARVPVRPGGDLVDELGRVFNQMIERIEALVAGMRAALDTVAHDLRTPVARLRARAESALRSSASEAEAREALAECIEEADRVTALLAALMDISEAETGTMRLSLDAVPVGEAVRDTVELYEDAAEERGVALSSHVQEGLLVRADRQRLRQVLANLVENAIKYTPAGGQVAIEAERAGDEITIRVRDTGVGIAPEDLPHIWERLYRGGGQGREPGLGLGLSLVKAIVEAHHGRAEVESPSTALGAGALGRGSTLTITLPAA